MISQTGYKSMLVGCVILHPSSISTRGEFTQPGLGPSVLILLSENLEYELSGSAECSFHDIGICQGEKRKGCGFGVASVVLKRQTAKMQCCGFWFSVIDVCF